MQSWQQHMGHGGRWLQEEDNASESDETAAKKKKKKKEKKEKTDTEVCMSVRICMHLLASACICVHLHALNP